MVQKTVYLTPWESLIFCVETLPSSRNRKCYRTCVFDVLGFTHWHFQIQGYTDNWVCNKELASPYIKYFLHWCLTRNCEYVIALCSLTWLTFARDLWIPWNLWNSDFFLWTKDGIICMIWPNMWQDLCQKLAIKRDEAQILARRSLQSPGRSVDTIVGA